MSARYESLTFFIKGVAQNTMKNTRGEHEGGRRPPLIKWGTDYVTGIRYLRYYLILARGGLASEDCSREFRISEVSPIYPPPEAKRRARPARGEGGHRASEASEGRTRKARTQSGAGAPATKPAPHCRSSAYRVINNGGARGASPTGEARPHAGGLPPKPPATFRHRLRDTGREGGN